MKFFYMVLSCILPHLIAKDSINQVCAWLIMSVPDLNSGRQMLKVSTKLALGWLFMSVPDLNTGRQM